MTAFGSGLSIRGRETLWVASLKPCDTVFRFIIGHVGVPRQEANGLANVGAGIDTVGLKELVLLVPEFCVYLLTEVFGLGEIGLGLAGQTSKHTDVANSHCIAIHIGIDRGTQIFLLTSA